MFKEQQKGQTIWSVLSEGIRVIELRSEKCLGVGDGWWEGGEEDR